MHIRLMSTVTAALLLTTTATLAQNAPDNLERLGQFKTTGAAPLITLQPSGRATGGTIARNPTQAGLGAD